MSAEDLVTVVRVHADRVHDAVRRLGCAPREAVEVVQRSAVDLVQVVADHPESVEDAVGWWFARASDLARGAAQRTGELPLGGGVLAVDTDQQVLAAALDELPERERMALLLRDSYDLPDVSVGEALGTAPDRAMALVARARLAVIPLVDDEPAPPVADHQEDLGALARLGEGGPVAARDATARRHALSCEACRAVTDSQQRAHLLLGGLTVVALPEGDRAAVLAQLEEAAFGLLPTNAALLLRDEEQQLELDDEDPRLLSPLLALAALVLAGLLGLGVGLLLSRDTPTRLAGAVGQLPPGVVLASPSPSAGPVDSSPRTVTAPAPRTSVFPIAPSPSPSPSPPPPPPSPQPSVAPAEPTTLTLNPSTGPDGQVLEVTGQGFEPAGEVVLEYLDTAGNPTSSRSVVAADGRGRFIAQLTALDPTGLPGPHTVRASDGVRSAETVYTAAA